MISESIYNLVAIPLLKQIPQGSCVITTKIMTPFLILLKLSFYVSIFIGIPFFFYHTWAFIEPGLYEKEKNLVLPATLLSIFFFYIGTLFSFYVVCPITINFFSTYTPKSVLFMLDIEHYLEFVLKTSILTGLIFQTPIITKIITKFNLIGKEDLKKKRKYVITIAFIIGMLVTPPDVISQIIVAIPIIILFELGLLVS
jgi:sec-independent protein translocase protein TatC